MKKKKEYILNIVYYSILCIFLFFGILNRELGNMDELWNFLSAKNIINGLLPYKDFNVIVTPFSMFVNSLFLHINPNLFTFRIIYFVWYLILIIILNKIMDVLNIKGLLKYFVLSVIMGGLLIACYYDYNFIQLVFILLLIYLSLKNKDYSNKRFNIFIPLIAGFTIINKQSTGVVICLITLLLLIINNHKNLKLLFSYSFIMLIPSLLFFIYLLISKSLFDFYDLCILGLFTFSNGLVVRSCIVYLIINYIVMIILFRRNKNRELIILFCYAIASLSVIIPIVDFHHSALAIIVAILFFAYIINHKIRIPKDDYSSSFIIIIVIIILSSFSIHLYFHTPRFKSGVYKNIPVDIQFEENIKNVSNYVLNQSKDHNVIIMDFYAPVYDLNMNRYEKYFDLFDNGNFGLYGKKEMYSVIKQKNNIILIDNHFIHWQRPDDIINYVKEKYDKCGSIEQFDVYCN